MANPEHDVEHYFPKGLRFFYMLMLHPYNLYFTCKTCNSSIYKSQKMPLENEQDNLQTTFLPFHAGAQEEVAFQFSRGTLGDSIQMIPSNPKAPHVEEKIRNLDRMFRLEERWTNDLEAYASSLLSHYSEEFAADEYEDFKADFSQMVRRRGRAVETNPEVTIESAYYSWLLKEKIGSIFETIKKDDFSG